MIEKKRTKPNREILFYISFSDMLSLLMAFFVLLFSMSTLDIVKFRKLSDSFTTVFDSKQKEEVLQQLEEEEKILQKIYEGLQAYIKSHSLEKDVAVKVDNHAIVMDLGSKLLFSLSEATLKSEAQNILEAFVGYFMQIEDANIVVEGHTDDIPISTKEFQSNWELSAARAASVVRFLASKGIKEGNCYVIGYNQYKPLVPNDSEENRAKNRRVRIIFKPITSKKEKGVNFKAIINEDSGLEIMDTTKNIGE